jgi:hypothetical protein
MDDVVYSIEEMSLPREVGSHGLSGGAEVARSYPALHTLFESITRHFIDTPNGADSKTSTCAKLGLTLSVSTRNKKEIQILLITTS